MSPPETYNPTPGGRYLIGTDGVRVRLDDATGLPAADSAPAPAPAAPATAPVAAAKPVTTKE